MKKRRSVWLYLALAAVLVFSLMAFVACTEPAHMHEYADGYCIMCGEKDPDYATSDEYFEFTYLTAKDSYSITAKNVVNLPSKIVLPSKHEGKPVTSLGENAFYYCSDLESIDIPSSVTYIDDHAFEYCSGLTSIEIPASVTYIGAYAFRYCSSLTDINVQEGNKQYKSIDGNLYSYDEKTLIQYAIGKKDKVFVIPSSVTTIGYYAFYSSNLTGVEIPSSVTSIGGYAFQECCALTSVEIPNSVTTICMAAFYNCIALKEVTFEEDSKLSSIQKEAFYGCTGLTGFNFNGTMAKWQAVTKGTNWNKDVPDGYKVYCQDGTLDRYNNQVA